MPLTFIDETVAVIAGIAVGLVVYYALPATRVRLSDRINRKLDS